MDITLGIKLVNVVICKPCGDVVWSVSNEESVGTEPLFRTSVFEMFSTTEEAKSFRDVLGNTLWGGGDATLCTNAVLRNGHKARICVDWKEEQNCFVLKWTEPINSEELTEKQLQIVQLMHEDRTIVEIAKQLGITESTCQSRLSALRSKFGVRTNYGLIAAL